MTTLKRKDGVRQGKKVWVAFLLVGILFLSIGTYLKGHKELNFKIGSELNLNQNLTDIYSEVADLQLKNSQVELGLNDSKMSISENLEWDLSNVALYEMNITNNQLELGMDHNNLIIEETDVILTDTLVNTIELNNDRLELGESTDSLMIDLNQVYAEAKGVELNNENLELGMDTLMTDSLELFSGNDLNQIYADVEQVKLNDSGLELGVPQTKFNAVSNLELDYNEYYAQIDSMELDNRSLELGNKDTLPSELDIISLPDSGINGLYANLDQMILANDSLELGYPKTSQLNIESLSLNDSDLNELYANVDNMTVDNDGLELGEMKGYAPFTCLKPVCRPQVVRVHLPKYKVKINLPKALIDRNLGQLFFKTHSIARKHMAECRKDLKKAERELRKIMIKTKKGQHTIKKFTQEIMVDLEKILEEETEIEIVIPSR